MTYRQIMDPDERAVAVQSFSRIGRVSRGDTAVDGLIRRMVRGSIAGLPAMYRPDRRRFAFTRRLAARSRLQLEGESDRYGAIALLGAMYLAADEQCRIFGGETAMGFCGRLIDRLAATTNLGDVAMVTWAAADLDHPQLPTAIQMLREMSRARQDCCTVEAAWTLSALVAARRQVDVRADATAACDRLVRAFSPSGSLFAHLTDQLQGAWYRKHVGCFADQVYPIQALARYHKAFGDDAALATANRCAAQICRLQGSGGQWWWHYDVRTGAVVEGYPVYSVHQDGMAPMALLDLQEAGGTDHGDAIRAGVAWMASAPEIGRSLIDEDLSVIWRKVARAEPGKMTRSVRAVASRLSPALRLGWLDRILRPVAIDHECRPYHLGWVLHAWLGGPR